MLPLILQIRLLAARLPLRNPCSLVHVAQADSENTNAVVAIKLFSRLDGLAFLVFAIGKDDYGLVIAGLIQKSGGRQPQRVAKSRAAAIEILRADVPQRLLEILIVAGEWNQLSRLAREGNQSDAVTRHRLEHIADLLFGAFQSARLDIFCQHRTRHIQDEHHLDAFLGNLAPDLAPADVNQSQHQSEHHAGH